MRDDDVKRVDAIEANIRVWWCGWEFPFSKASDPRVAEKFPPGLKGWISGETCDDDPRQTWVGRVEAESIDDARALIASMYGDLAEHLTERWEPKERPAGWQPEGGRFT